jgi:HD-like signal output (HDOD) protein
MGMNEPFGHIDATTIASRLVNEFGFSAQSAELTAGDLLSCSQVVLDAFVRWWRTGELGNLEVEGISAAKLTSEHGLTPVGAFLMLNWLLADPARAKAVLSRGFDTFARRGDSR